MIVARWPCLLLLLAIGTPASAQPLADEECVRLLGGDEERTPVRDAAVRNLAAAAVRATAEARRTTEAVLDAGLATAENATRVCAAFSMERARNDALLTGYYRPLVPARRSREGEYRHPLFALPDQTFRNHSRAEIDQGALDGKVPVVAWLADPVEVFFVQIQGSALLTLPDGPMAVGYAGSNERPYSSIGALLVREGVLRREDVSMSALKAYLRAHPSERDRVLRANERYIYFKRLDDEAIGSLGVGLTAGRSVAADPKVYAPGSLLFLHPTAGSSGVSARLVFVQDQGSAITGSRRLDLFLGTGDEAGRIAGALQQEVEVFVLRAR